MLGWCRGGDHHCACLQVELQRIFKVLGRTRVQYRTEKNWGFVEGPDGDLLIFYQVITSTRLWQSY